MIAVSAGRYGASSAVAASRDDGVLAELVEEIPNASLEIPFTRLPDSLARSLVLICRCFEERARVGDVVRVLVALDYSSIDECCESPVDVAGVEMR